VDVSVLYKLVMPGLVPGIHVLVSASRKTWMAGTSPAMTMGKRQPRDHDRAKPKM
jgi:hypothetical protein